MPTRPFNFFCVHAHFYQPPRGNSVTGDIGEEAGAGKYRNWNERANAESYRPNAEMGNFDQISFNIGETLLEWLDRHAPETYRRIVQADRLHFQRKKVGNALAMPMHHAILPLLKRRDKRTQLAWGKAAFKHRFGREPQGIWLPELAIDPDTLMAVEELGYRFTVVAHGQVEGGVEGGGPYWVDLENGRRLAVFVRDDFLSNDLAFNIASVGGAGHWARNKLGGRRPAGSPLTLLATNGETFGHHHLGEDQFLRWLLEHEASAVGYRVVTLNEYLRDFPPQESIRLKPFSSWSCFHGIARWSTGCECTPGDSAWKGVLLRAFDNAADELDTLYAEEASALGLDPWPLREAYIRVWLQVLPGAAFLAEYKPGLPAEAETRLLALLEAQMLMAKAYTSVAFYHEDVDRPESRYSIGTVAYALRTAERATGLELQWQFRNALRQVRSGVRAVDGAQIYDEVVAQAELAPGKAEVDAAEPDSLEMGDAAASTV